MAAVSLPPTAREEWRAGRNGKSSDLSSCMVGRHMMYVSSSHGISVVSLLSLLTLSKTHQDASYQAPLLVSRLFAANPLSIALITRPLPKRVVENEAQ